MVIVWATTKTMTIELQHGEDTLLDNLIGFIAVMLVMKISKCCVHALKGAWNI